MNHTLISAKLIAIVLSIYFILPILNTCVKACEDILTPQAKENWNTLSEFRNTLDLYTYLKDHGWIGDLTCSDFDYILVLTDQLASFYDNVDTSLILAQIAVESRFDIYADNGTAHGLMQLVPLYQEGRMRQFVEEDHIFSLDDFYDPRLNVVTGIDYMSEILKMTDGDICYALMWYNEGPSRSTKHYKDDGITSYYAKEVTKLQAEIETYLTEGRV